MRWVITALLGFLLDILIVWVAVTSASTPPWGHGFGVFVGCVVAFLGGGAIVAALTDLYGVAAVWPKAGR